MIPEGGKLNLVAKKRLDIELMRIIAAFFCAI